MYYFPDGWKKRALRIPFRIIVIAVIGNILSVMCILYFDQRMETISINWNFPDV